MSKWEDTINTIRVAQEVVSTDNMRFFAEPGCLLSVLSDIAISLAIIADALTERGQDER